MLNHFRTLLMNVSRDGLGPDALAAEYTPPEFVPMALPRSVAKLSSVLYGRRPDQYMLNWRTRQVLQVVHATELAEYITALDPRITYLPFPVDAVYNGGYAPSIRNIDGHTNTLTTIGTLQPDEFAGKLFYSWRIEIYDADNVRITSQIPPTTTTLTPYAMYNDRSESLALPGSNWACTVSGPVGTAWELSCIARPQRDAATVLALLKSAMTEVDALELFGTAPVEPFKTFSNCWFKHPSFAHQLGGLLLAAVYRLDVLRKRV